jgi:hypothetical protein
MTNAQLVWRSDSGQRAWECMNSGLPSHYRRILDLIASPTLVAALVSGLGDYSAKQIQDWLDELETLCFIDTSRLDRAVVDPRSMLAA